MGTPLLFTEEFEVVIMIADAIEEMHGSDRVLPDAFRETQAKLVAAAATA